MRTKTLPWTTGIMLCTALAMPSWLAAQEQQERRERQEHHRYKMVDLGTFGGPNSYLPEPNQAIRALNNRGVVAGSADTSTADPFCLNADCLASHTFRWQNGVLMDLGALPGATPGLNLSQPQWINDRGDIVGASENGKIDPALAFPEFRAVLWKDGRIIDLGTFGGTVSIAYAINDRVQVAGFALNAIPDPFPLLGFPFLAVPPVTQSRAFLWEKGEMRDLGTLGGPDAAAFWVNESGQVAGCSLTNSTPSPTTGKPTADPFFWTKNDGMIDLGTLGGTNGCASDLNNHGQVVGFSNLEGDQAGHPFLWDDGVLTDLGTFGGSFGFPEGINEFGEIVGEAGFPGDVMFHAVLWTKGTITDLGTVDGDPSSVAFHINSNGQVVGASTNLSGEWIHAFLWENRGPMIDLNTLVPAGTDVQLISAPDISDRGEIAALGILPNAETHAFLLIPCEKSDDGCENEAEPAATTRKRLLDHPSNFSRFVANPEKIASNDTASFADDRGGSPPTVSLLDTAGATLKIISTAPPSGRRGKRYDTHCNQIPPCNIIVSGFPLTATGGVPPYSWTWAGAQGSSVPAGLNINGLGCLHITGPAICGVPTATGLYNVIVTVTDSGRQATHVSAKYAINIFPH